MTDDLGVRIHQALFTIWVQNMSHMDPASTIGPEGDWDLKMLHDMRDAVLKIVEDRELMNMWKGVVHEQED